MADTFTRDRFSWLDAVASHPTLGAAHFLLAYLISALINRRTGDAWPGLDYLAKAMKMNERNVRRLVDALVRQGFLTKSRGGDGKPNRYRLVLPDRTPESSLNDSRPDSNVRSETLDITNESIRPDNDVHSENSDRTFETDRPDISDTQTGHQCPPISLNTSLKDLSEEEYISVKPPSRADLDDEFEELWKQYPRKVAKGQARKAFRAARKKTELATIKAGVLRYAAERDGQDPKYTRHLATWLNAESWLDEAPSPFVTAHSRSPRLTTGKDRAREVLEHMLSNGEDEAHE